MEFIELRLICLSRILLFCFVLTSCQIYKSDNQKDALLECILTNFITHENNGDFLVGQHDNWTKSTSLIIVSYIPKGDVQYIQAEEKSRFNKKDVYYYREEISHTITENTVQKIANQLKWELFNSQNSINEDQSPYDPITVQLTYNYSSNCIENIVVGERYLRKDWELKCKSCSLH